MFTAAPAMAQSWPAPEYYGSLGYSHMEADGADVELGAITGRFGAKLTPYFGFEGEGSFGVRDDEVTIGAVTADIDHNYDLAAYGVAFLPVNPNFELFARLGYGTTELEPRPRASASPKTAKAGTTASAPTTSSTARTASAATGPVATSPTTAAKPTSTR
nr:outer membrane beta-barrel protein [Brevundimonas abyssalis]